MTQEKLLNIVKTFNIKMKPEYRGFRCAKCQKRIFKAWHYQLRERGYRAPVHFCNQCDDGSKEGVYKNFTCDKCGKNTRKAYHVWEKKNGVLFEEHFCKKCFGRD